LNLSQGLNGLVQVGAHTTVGDPGPAGKLHQLAVEQDQLHRGVERCGGQQQRQRAGLARAGFAAEQHVPLG